MNAIALGRLIGKGLTADVYELDAERVLKLSFDWRRRDRVQLEFDISRWLHAAGVPCPAVHELVEVNGRIGLIFERIDGISMFRSLQSKPWLLRKASRELAEIHARMHEIEAPGGLPSQRDQFERWIHGAHDLSAEELNSAREALEQAQPGSALCHGDFHPENIIYSRRGPIIIDWSTGTRGDPIADVARTSHLFLRAGIPAGTPFHMRLLVNVFRKLVNQVYLARYFQLRPGGRSLLARYGPLQAAAHSAWRCSRFN
jgi:uncharacterized protein (TIGR02172 family)